MRRLSIGPTWFIFVADHGEMLGDHNLYRKTYAYEGSARIPLIVAPPQGSAAHLATAPVSQPDIMPTVLEIAGIKPPATVQGRSLLPLCAAESPAQEWREYVHGEHSKCYAADHGMQFLCDGREKYIWYTQSGEEQLFDLRNDPEECHNLAGQASSRKRLALWRKRMVMELAPRKEDGLSDGQRLLPGRSLPAVRPSLMQG